MLAEFQKLFVDPDSHSPLTFDGETRDGRWWEGRLVSDGGREWRVRDGIPDFVPEPVEGARWTQEAVDELLADGVYERTWANADRRLNDGLPGFAAAVKEAAQETRPIIDIGSGPGGGFVPAAFALNPQAVVMANDAAAVLLHCWRAFLEEKDIACALCFAAFDAMHLPLASDSVPVLTSAGGFSSVADPLLGFREAARVLAEDGVLYAAEFAMEPEGLKALSHRVGWEYEEEFGERYSMTYPEMFEECGLKIARQEFYFRRKMESWDNEIAAKACEVGAELRTGGDVYWLEKRQ